MFRRAALLFAALALFFIAGGHWAALQTVAWAGMLVDYTHASGSLRVAVARTFDGQHPCDLCRTVANGRQQDQERQAPVSTAVKIEKKAESLIVADAPAPRRSEGVTRTDWPAFAANDGSVPAARPPTPPPRVSEVG